MIGVNYDLFWTLTPKSLEPFIKAFELQQKREDTLAWQSGIYIQMAIASVLDSKNKYPEQPFSEREIVPLSPQERIKNAMLARMAIINKRFEEVGEIVNE